MSDKALAVIEAHPVALQTLENAPAVVLAEAQKAAAALKDVIANKPHPVIINGEQYLEAEDWATVARFYGITAGIEHEPEFIELGGVSGFKATAVALRNGQIISRATSFCMKDEERWSAAPTYQVASMAQTRACAKVLRNCLSWVVVLAGYKATPAEEMDGVKTKPRGNSVAKPECPKCHSAKDVIVGKYPDKATKVQKPWYCLKDRFTWGNSEQAPTAERVGTDPEYAGEAWSPDDDRDSVVE